MKDGTHKEAFSVIMNSDSIELNPLDTINDGPKIPYEKKKKGIQKPRHRSRSRGDRMTPIFPGREQRDDSYQMRQARAQQMNIPPRSPSRKNSHRIETVRFRFTLAAFFKCISKYGLTFTIHDILTTIGTTKNRRRHPENN
jgi:hypothetical protein